MAVTGRCGYHLFSQMEKNSSLINKTIPSVRVQLDIVGIWRRLLILHAVHIARRGDHFSRSAILGMSSHTRSEPMMIDELTNARINALAEAFDELAVKHAALTAVLGAIVEKYPV